MTPAFPPGFLWGAATSGYQIEGGARAGGKGPSIWDTFAARPGSTLHGDTGEHACNAWDPAQLEADLDLMARLGLGAYIFSVQWPRIQPSGRGPANQLGLDYYRRLVDGLCARGIVPVLTLYHWELPEALQRHGGWTHRDTALRFADYAVHVYDALARQVPLWVTQNEPHNSAWLGHASGKHAPGLRDDSRVPAVAHHLMLAHGLAVQALRDRVPGVQTRFGPVLNMTPFRPERPGHAPDRAAAMRLDGEQNRLFLELVFRGTWPADVRRRFERRGVDFAALVQPGDLATIATPLDFLGVNYYAPATVAAGRGGAPAMRPTPGPKTAMGWPIDPAGLFEVLTRLRGEYTGELPLLVSENGVSCRDYVDPEGRCHDPERIEFLGSHMRQAQRAIEAGVPLKGWFVWSLLDNFEWDSGYRERFGLVHVDYPTQARTPKDSFEWYRSVIAANRLPL